MLNYLTVLQPWGPKKEMTLIVAHKWTCVVLLNGGRDCKVQDMYMYSTVASGNSYFPLV